MSRPKGPRNQRGRSPLLTIALIEPLTRSVWRESSSHQDTSLMLGYGLGKSLMAREESRGSSTKTNNRIRREESSMLRRPSVVSVPARMAAVVSVNSLSVPLRYRMGGPLITLTRPETTDWLHVARELLTPRHSLFLVTASGSLWWRVKRPEAVQQRQTELIC